MMKNYNVDIHTIIKKLTQAKIQNIHAEAIAQAIAVAVKNVPSGEYIELRFDKTLSSLDQSIQKLKAELLAWYIGVGLVQMTALITSILIMLSGGK